MSNKTNTNTNTKLTPEAQQWITELRNQRNFSDRLFEQCEFCGNTTADQRREKVTMKPLQYKGFTITLKKYGRAPRYILTGNNTQYEGYWFEVASKLYELTH